MSTYPGFYAVPGSMWPGAIWPGEVITAAVTTGPPVVFAAGSPYFRWETQEPYLS